MVDWVFASGVAVPIAVIAYECLPRTASFGLAKLTAPTSSTVEALALNPVLIKVS